VDVDAGLPAPRGSNANARLRRKPRGGYGCIRQELAAGVSKKRRIYKPRLVDGKVMMTADLRCLLKYMPDERIDHISDEMRAVVESEWPELAHKRAQETAGLTHASLKALLENAC
jgi:hypothetical protein